MDDAEAVATLNGGLGYPATTDSVRTRLELLLASKERLALVAVWCGIVVGWIDAALEHHLQSEPVVTIGGLVVSEDMRGNGIGQQLCLAVEAWAAQIGVTAVRVRSQQKRTDAHRFYARDGYKEVKTSLVLEKRISPQS
jgi:(aminoalkyl)phosphonate N-acetyltransferase